MTIKYAQTAWADIKSSPNWFGKLLLLSLVAMIPIFGTIVVYGYLLNWTREIAWQYKTPLPPRIFGNENGNLYKLGFFAFVVNIVIAVILNVVSVILDGGALTRSFSHSGYFIGMYGLSSAFMSFMISMAVAVFLTLFNFASYARMSIYGTLSSGFQVNRLWEMIRFDVKGLFKILGMTLLIMLIAFVALSIIASILIFAFIFLVVGATGDYGFATQYSLSRSLSFGLGLGSVVFLIAILAFCYLTAIITVFTDMMCFRALGYWVAQMNVAKWGPQDTPIFGAVANQPTNTAYAQPQQYQQPYTPPAPQQQVQPQPQQPVQQQPQQPVQQQPQVPLQPQQPVQQQAQQPAQQSPSEPNNPHEGA